MFSNIGEKIKIFAVICCVLGIIASLAGSAFVASQSNSWHNTSSEALIVLVVGCLVSWIGSFYAYGFGQLIVHLKNIDEKLNGTYLPNKLDSKNDQMKQWLDEGLISEEEYNKSIGRKDEQFV